MLQRQAQWRLDFIAAENSMGLHAPQEAAKVIPEAADLARQGEVDALKALLKKPETQPPVTLPSKVMNAGSFAKFEPHTLITSLSVFYRPPSCGLETQQSMTSLSHLSRFHSFPF